jgi:hypothetical protein
MCVFWEGCYLRTGLTIRNGVWRLGSMAWHYWCSEPADTPDWAGCDVEHVTVQAAGICRGAAGAWAQAGQRLDRRLLGASQRRGGLGRAAVARSIVAPARARVALTYGCRSGPCVQAVRTTNTPLQRAS